MDSSKSTLDVYEEYLQKPFIAATEAYYKSESEKFISENPVPEYLKKVALMFIQHDAIDRLMFEISDNRPRQDSVKKIPAFSTTSTPQRRSL
jgi:cullin 1